MVNVRQEYVNIKTGLFHITILYNAYSDSFSQSLGGRCEGQQRSQRTVELYHVYLSVVVKEGMRFIFAHKINK